MDNWPNVDVPSGAFLSIDEQRTYGRSCVERGVGKLSAELGQTVVRLEWLDKGIEPFDRLMVERDGMPRIVIPVTEEEIEDIHSTPETRSSVENLIRSALRPQPLPPLSGMAKATTQ
jgi:hypothetical protein